MRINPATTLPGSLSCAGQRKREQLPSSCCLLPPSRSPRALQAGLATICLAGMLWLWSLGSLLDATRHQSIQHAWNLVKDKALASQTRLFELQHPQSQTLTTQDASEAKSNGADQELVQAEYECVGWRQTGGCSPNGPREPHHDKPCNASIPNGASGYCEVFDRTTNETKRMLQMHCDSLRYQVTFTCDLFREMMVYQQQATDYVHDPTFTFEANQRDLLSQNAQYIGEPAFDRAIVMVVYEKVLPSVYASVLNLRSMNVSLPVEMWYRSEEVEANHVLLRELVAHHGVLLREIEDPHATWFYAKLHAVFYSAFDQILFLDADNFAVRDPTFLFELPQFKTMGAIFWPDYWHPGHSLFNVHAQSAVWELFGLPFVDEFEQESGQLLINRRQHVDALNTLMFYGFHRPRLHQQLNVVWGDKDLFRFAWRKTNSSFHYIPFAPGSAGSKGHIKGEEDRFCGATMVQHDVNNQVLFLHRNNAKFYSASSSDNPKSVRVWTHIQQFRLPPQDFRKYQVGRSPSGPLHPTVRVCFGKHEDYNAEFTVKPMEAFGLDGFEDKLLRFVEDANDVLRRR